MKKLILFLTIAACAALTVQAQDDKPKRPEGRPEGRPGAGRFTPEERLKRLTEALTLTQDQQDKIKKIFEDGRTEFEALKDVPQDQRREKFRELAKAQNEKILAVLTPEQQEKFKAQIAERTRRATGGGEGRGEAPKPPGDKKEGEPK